MPDLTQERIIDYMRHRKQEKASGRTINLELSVLSRALGRIHLDVLLGQK